MAIYYEEKGKLRALFAKNLRKLMRKRKLTAMDLAAEMGIRPGTVRNWSYSKGNTMPTPPLYESLCDTLEIGYWELLCEDFEDE